jgi:hypothetical protein
VQRSGHIGVGDSAKVVSFSAPEEGEDFVVDDVRHGPLKAGSRKGDLTVLSKSMLNCRGQRAQLWKLLAVDFVEGDKKTSLMLRQEVGEYLNLASQARFDNVAFKAAPRDRSDPHWSGDAGEALLDRIWIEVSEEAR